MKFKNKSTINGENDKFPTSIEDKLFEKFPKLIRPQVLADHLGLSINTIYDWKYRGKTRRIPENLFLKISGRLYVRTDVLNKWLLGCPL